MSAKMSEGTRTFRAPCTGHASVPGHPSSNNPRETIMIVAESDSEGIDCDSLQAHYSRSKSVVTLAVYYGKRVYIQNIAMQKGDLHARVPIISLHTHTQVIHLMPLRPSLSLHKGTPPPRHDPGRRLSPDTTWERGGTEGRGEEEVTG